MRQAVTTTTFIWQGMTKRVIGQFTATEARAYLAVEYPGATNVETR